MGDPKTIAAFQPLIDAGRSARDVFSQLMGTIDNSKWQAWGTANGAQARQWAEDLAAAGAAIQTLSDAWGKFSSYSSMGPGDMLANTRREFESLKATWDFLTQPLDFTHSFDGLKTAAAEIRSYDWAGLGANIGSGIASGVMGMLSGMGDRIKSMFTIGGSGGGPKPGSTPNAFNGFKGGGVGGLSVAGARALGGPVGGGMPYLVGERGPEIFVPGGSGKVETHAALNRLMERQGGGSTTTVNHGDIHLAVTVNAQSHDARGISQEVARALRWELQKMQRAQRGKLND